MPVDNVNAVTFINFKMRVLHHTITVWPIGLIFTCSLMQVAVQGSSVAMPDSATSPITARILSSISVMETSLWPPPVAVIDHLAVARRFFEAIFISNHFFSLRWHGINSTCYFFPFLGFSRSLNSTAERKLRQEHENVLACGPLIVGSDTCIITCIICTSTLRNANRLASYCQWNTSCRCFTS